MATVRAGLLPDLRPVTFRTARTGTPVPVFVLEPGGADSRVLVDRISFAGRKGSQGDIVPGNPVFSENRFRPGKFQAGN
jgi:hypothetical protein